VSPSEQSALEQRFHQLAEQWREDTRYLASVHKIVSHSAYQQIIEMGQDALPLIFQDLERSRGHWLWALCAITGEDPVPDGSTFAEAVDAWLRWGVQQGYATKDK
jgi:hypothetical protein